MPANILLKSAHQKRKVVEHEHFSLQNHTKQNEY